MNRIPVSSTNIKSIGWENNILEIAFKSGGIWQYIGVSNQLYLRMMSASSKGTFFHDYIKDKFLERKVGA